MFQRALAASQDAKRETEKTKMIICNKPFWGLSRRENNKLQVATEPRRAVFISKGVSPQTRALGWRGMTSSLDALRSQQHGFEIFNSCRN